VKRGSHGRGWGRDKQKPLSCRSYTPDIAVPEFSREYSRPARQRRIPGHPKGVYVCFFTEMWERFSFYGMKALLLLYLIEHHKFGDAIGLDVLGAYGGLVYCLPVFGGMLADRWLGMRKAVVFGAILLCLGHFGMAVEGDEAHMVNGVMMRDTGALDVFYLSLALIITASVSSSRTFPRSSANSTKRAIRVVTPASRCSTPASISARCSRRWSAASSAKPTAGDSVSAPPASACCSG
jgi:hypothetical protein